MIFDLSVLGIGFDSGFREQHLDNRLPVLSLNPIPPERYPHNSPMYHTVGLEESLDQKSGRNAVSSNFRIRAFPLLLDCHSEYRDKSRETNVSKQKRNLCELK